MTPPPATATETRSANDSEQSAAHSATSFQPAATSGTAEARPPTASASALACTIGVFLAAALIFMALQNSSGAIGGPISLPKALWLHCAITMFYIVPWFLWRNTALSAPVRALYGWLLLSFVTRGAVELVIIYTTHAWQCIHGISHNAATLALAVGLFLSLPGARSTITLPAAEDSPDRRALWFFPIYIATLCLESLNAWQFSLLADPSRGIYFAADTAHFAFVNRLTCMELALLWPALCAFIVYTRPDFKRV